MESISYFCVYATKVIDRKDIYRLEGLFGSMVSKLYSRMAGEACSSGLSLRCQKHAALTHLKDSEHRTLD